MSGVYHNALLAIERRDRSHRPEFRKTKKRLSETIGAITCRGEPKVSLQKTQGSTLRGFLAGMVKGEGFSLAHIAAKVTDDNENKIKDVN